MSVCFFFGRFVVVFILSIFPRQAGRLSPSILPLLILNHCLAPAFMEAGREPQKPMRRPSSCSDMTSQPAREGFYRPRECRTLEAMHGDARPCSPCAFVFRLPFPCDLAAAYSVRIRSNWQLWDANSCSSCFFPFFCFACFSVLWEKRRGLFQSRSTSFLALCHPVMCSSLRCCCSRSLSFSAGWKGKKSSEIGFGARFGPLAWLSGVSHGWRQAMLGGSTGSTDSTGATVAVAVLLC